TTSCIQRKDLVVFDNKKFFKETFLPFNHWYINLSGGSLRVFQLELIKKFSRPDLWDSPNRVGGVVNPVLSHHRTYGSVYGGSIV
ncbi:hypothetical protein ACE1TI_03840, partial [Alteribacillus sp. JSM 102045]|uniref:hypothetical protein n=1 Tax=Alteribacillus sp. JSM 102045 TaxID=1562101 RepID=UPI0035BEFA7B